jgi:hypothetical protein
MVNDLKERHHAKPTGIFDAPSTQQIKLNLMSNKLDASTYLEILPAQYLTTASSKSTVIWKST